MQENIDFGSVFGLDMKLEAITVISMQPPKNMEKADVFCDMNMGIFGHMVQFLKFF